jgi:hypothetical protein
MVKRGFARFALMVGESVERISQSFWDFTVDHRHPETE